MANLINRADVPLPLPMGGPVLPAGLPIEVKRWNIIKGHAVVKAWLQAKAIEEVGEEDTPASELTPAPSPELENDELIALRAEYQEKVGKRAYHAWDAETLRAKIAEAGAE